MKLADFYPLPVDMIKREADTLAYLVDNPYITEKHSEFARAVAEHYKQLRTGTSHLSFNSFLMINHQGRKLMLVISALVERVGRKDYGNISYCLTVCRPHKPRPTILRKFHFDIAVAPASGHRTQPHPICHVQYCGELIPFLKLHGCTDEQLSNMHPWLSEPRLFFWPMSFALLLDLVLREFPTPEGTKFRNASEWRSIVRANELLLLAPFHKKCFHIASNQTRDNKMLADEFYVH